MTTVSVAAGGSGHHSPTPHAILTAWRDQAGPGAATCVPVVRHVLADLDTPVSAFLKLHAGLNGGVLGPSFLLESVEGGEKVGRYSLLGLRPRRMVSVGGVALSTTASLAGVEYEHVVDGDPTVLLSERLGRVVALSVPGHRVPSFWGGAIGYVGYDAVRHFEPRTAAALNGQASALPVPEAVFMMCDTVVVFDHVRHTMTVVAIMPLPPRHGTTEEGAAAAIDAAHAQACKEIDSIAAVLSWASPAASTAASALITPLSQASARVAPPAPARGGDSTASADWAWERRSNMGRAGYEAGVTGLKAHIVDGDIIQAVISHRIGRPLPPAVSSFDVYRHLRIINPSPYVFYLHLGDRLQLVGASPEMMVKVDAQRKVYTHPIAGTRRRGATPEEDEALEAELLRDEKERAEHVMLVDLGRNDLGRVCAPGSVRVDSLMHVERYSHVMHIVSNVSGTLAEGNTALDAFRSVFPAGTVSGAPKVRAMELVAAAEREKRHVYAGAVGYWGYNSIIDTAIAIRTVVVCDHVAYLQAGAGIVYDSVPPAEYEETVAKLRGVMRALDAACAGLEEGGATGGAATPS